MKLVDDPLTLPERLARLKGKMVQDHEVVHVPPEYIVIGNFKTLADKHTAKIFNEVSGLSDKIFSFVVKDFAKQAGLSVIENFGDSLVVKGNKKNFEAARMALGMNFSYAHIDEANLEELICAEADYQRNGYMIPGSEKPEVGIVQAPAFYV
tara:strand:+ start:415 stop:870 length:456 start_codon:yes stop_codon:yes gene_type:complete